MVVIPCFYTPDADVHCQCVLDFGAVQGQWSNYWLYVDPNAEEIPRDYREPSQVLISNSDMKAFKDGKVYGIHMLTNVKQPILRIASKGWHTVMCFMKQDSAAVTNADYKCYSDDYNGEIASVIPEEFGDGSIQMFGISIMPLATYHGFLMKGMSGGHFS